MRLPAAMDGTSLVQRLVAPGETFEYRFTLLDAGTFWYHSHANETVQVERGLYGALVVRGPDEPAFDAERVLVLDDEDVGAVIAIEGLPYRRSRMVWPRRTSWATLRVGPRAPSRASLPATLATIEPLVPPGPVTPTRTVRLGARMTLHGHDWLINGEAHHHDAPVKVGELQVWDIVNDTGMDHPFHLHGCFFQVVAEGGVPTVPRAWEDTVNVVAKGRVTIAFRADDRPGAWMYHCHILEHHAAGMMGHFEVVR